MYSSIEWDNMSGLYFSHQDSVISYFFFFPRFYFLYVFIRSPKLSFSRRAGNPICSRFSYSSLTNRPLLPAATSSSLGKTVCLDVSRVGNASTPQRLWLHRRGSRKSYLDILVAPRVLLLVIYYVPSDSMFVAKCVLVF